MKLRFFLIIVLATAFLSCTKYETRVRETKIVSTSVSDVGFTTAKLTIMLRGDRWLADDTGFEIQGYANWDSLTYSWYEDENFEDWNNREYRIHFEIDGLLPGMTYRWRPYIEKGDIVVYGEFLDFTTEM